MNEAADAWMPGRFQDGSGLEPKEAWVGLGQGAGCVRASAVWGSLNRLIVAASSSESKDKAVRHHYSAAAVSRSASRAKSVSSLIWEGWS